jgi:hypothetical protein
MEVDGPFGRNADQVGHCANTRNCDYKRNMGDRQGVGAEERKLTCCILRSFGNPGAEYSRQFCTQDMERRSRRAVISLSPKEMPMRLLGKLSLAVTLACCAWSSLMAQQEGRQQDGFYSGRANAQVDERVDGRANKNEGLPPSVADKGNRTYDNPIRPDDCAEVDALRPEARPGWQARVRAACGQD